MKLLPILPKFFVLPNISRSLHLAGCITDTGVFDIYRNIVDVYILSHRLACKSSMAESPPLRQTRRELLNERSNRERDNVEKNKQKEFLASFMHDLHATVGARVGGCGQANSAGGPMQDARAAGPGFGSGSGIGLGPQLLDCLARLLMGEDKCAAVFHSFAPDSPNAPIWIARNFLDFPGPIQVQRACVSSLPEKSSVRPSMQRLLFNGITFGPTEQPLWCYPDGRVLEFFVQFSVDVQEGQEGKVASQRMKRARAMALEVIDSVQFALENYCHLVDVMNNNCSPFQVLVDPIHSRAEKDPYKALFQLSGPLQQQLLPSGGGGFRFSPVPLLRAVEYIRMLGHQVVRAVDRARAEQIPFEKCMPPNMHTHKFWPFILSESVSFEFLPTLPPPDNSFANPASSPTSPSNALLEMHSFYEQLIIMYCTQRVHTPRVSAEISLREWLCPPGRPFPDYWVDSGELDDDQWPAFLSTREQKLQFFRRVAEGFLDLALLEDLLVQDSQQDGRIARIFLDNQDSSFMFVPSRPSEHSLHAEIRLLEELHARFPDKPNYLQQGYFGVSKPLCALCTFVFAKFELPPTSYNSHTLDIYPDWSLPPSFLPPPTPILPPSWLKRVGKRLFDADTLEKLGNLSGHSHCSKKLSVRDEALSLLGHLKETSFGVPSGTDSDPVTGSESSAVLTRDYAFPH